MTLYISCDADSAHGVRIEALHAGINIGTSSVLTSFSGHAALADPVIEIRCPYTLDKVKAVVSHRSLSVRCEQMRSVRSGMAPHAGHAPQIYSAVGSVLGSPHTNVL